MELSAASIPDGYGAVQRYVWAINWMNANTVIEWLESVKSFPQTTLLLRVLETAEAKPPILRMELTGFDPKDKGKQLMFGTLDFDAQDFMDLT